jgi:FixJ family two-component response regulator
MTPLDVAVAAQQNVNAATEERRRRIDARDRAVCDAYASGLGRTQLSKALGVSVSTVDHILDRRRCA